MTISSSTRKAGPFTGNGTATTFPFTFKVFQASDLLVVRLNTSTFVESILVLNTDYTVTLNQNQNTNPGGSIVLGSALATGFTLTATSDIQNLQPTDLTNQGGFYPTVINDALDRTTIQIQQIQEEVDRSLKYPISDPATGAVLPSVGARASKVLAFDPTTGAPIAGPSIGDVATVVGNLADIHTVASDVANINIIAADKENIDAVAGDLTNINAVAGDLTNINAVKADLANIDVVATNVADVNNFADVYQGAKANDPTLRNNGSALHAGDMYFNTAVNEIRIYSGTVWVAGTAGTMAVQRFNGTGSATAFTLATAPAGENNTQVYINGVYQQKDSYSVSGVTLTFDSAPPAGTGNVEVVTISTLALGATDAALVSTTAGTGGLWSTVQGFINRIVSSIGSSLVGFIQSGTGSIARTSQDKMREQVSVLDFGADPTGAVDSTTAVQAAINSLSAGGAVVFPSGDYKITTVYVQNDRVNLVGTGDSTVIINSTTANGIEIGLSGAILSFCDVVGLKFDRPIKSSSGAAVKYINTAYSKVVGCGFKNSYIGVHVKTHNDSLQILNNTFYDGTYYGVYEYNQNETWANDLTVRGNFFWHVEQAGVYMSADGVGVASVGDTYIENNVFVSSNSKGALQSQYAIRVVGAGTYNTNVAVRNNTFEGIRLQTVYMTGMNRCWIQNNYFSGTGTNDVGLYFGGGAGNSIISGNTFIGFNNPGAYVYSTNSITISGNHFTSNVTTIAAYAELGMLNVQDVQIIGNYFYSSSSKYCIDITQSGSPVDNITIVGNRFSKYASNSNYTYDIRHNNYGGAKLMRGNIGNDVTSGAGTAAPVAGMALQWYAGDKIENKTASELGTAGSKYVLIGWVCTAQGDPGTWVQQRVLTGN